MSEQEGHVEHDLSMGDQIGPQKQTSTHDGKDLIKIFHPNSEGGHEQMPHVLLKPIP